MQYYENSSYLIVDLNEDEIGSWMNYEDGNEVSKLVGNIKFKADADIYMKEIQGILEHSFLNITQASVNSNEGRFITTYIYPFLLCTLIALFIAFKISYKYFFKRMYKEYTIHFFYGATLYDIILRSSVMIIISTMLISSLFTWTIVRSAGVDSIVYLGYGLILLLLLIIEIMIVHQIKKHDFMVNLRGG